MTFKISDQKKLNFYYFLILINHFFLARISLKLDNVPRQTFAMATKKKKAMIIQPQIVSIHATLIELVILSSPTLLKLCAFVR